MSQLAEIITVPDFESNVHGLDLTVVVGIEPSFTADRGIAHAEYLFVEIQNLGTNPHYPKVPFSKVILAFIVPGDQIIKGEHEGVIFVTMRSDVHTTRITLEENLNDADHIGANLVFWAGQHDQKCIEVLVAPLQRLLM